jgi:hypothetical protein
MSYLSYPHLRPSCRIPSLDFRLIASRLFTFSPRGYIWMTSQSRSILSPNAFVRRETSMISPEELDKQRDRYSCSPSCPLAPQNVPPLPPPKTPPSSLLVLLLNPTPPGPFFALFSISSILIFPANDELHPRPRLRSLSTASHAILLTLPTHIYEAFLS